MNGIEGDIVNEPQVALLAASGLSPFQPLYFRLALLHLVKLYP